MGRRPVIAGALKELMGEGARHAWTLEELHGALVERGHSADFSSVFRSATRLESEGVLRRVELVGGRARYELSEDHHDHLSCGSCGTLVPVPCKVVETIRTDVEHSTGFTLTGHRLLLTGTCPACREAAARATRQRSAG